MAMKLSRTVAYGVQATLQLARTNSTSPVPCSQLAAEGHMPERFLLQILRHLVTHGILHSTRGVDGGYNLERTPEEISLLELIEAIDGPLHSALPVGEGVPLHYDAKLREALETITETARQQLSAIKLSHLLQAPPSGQNQGRTESTGTAGGASEESTGEDIDEADVGRGDVGGGAVGGSIDEESANLRSQDWPTSAIAENDQQPSNGGHANGGPSGTASGSDSADEYRQRQAR
jgi:Rrf2 family transcriptional regulator, cysteine metabolism repressor